MGGWPTWNEVANEGQGKGHHRPVSGLQAWPCGSYTEAGYQAQSQTPVLRHQGLLSLAKRLVLILPNASTWQDRDEEPRWLHFVQDYCVSLKNWL